MKCYISKYGQCALLCGGWCNASGCPCYDEALKRDKVVTQSSVYINKNKEERGM